MAGYSQRLVLAELAPWLAERARAVNGFSFARVIDAASQILESSTKQNFDYGHSPDGRPWAPLKKPRPRNKRAMLAGFAGANPGLPLRDTGALMASLTSRGAKHFDERTADTLEWGTVVSYATYHQKGTRNKDGTVRMVARPFLGINTEATNDIVSLVSDEIAGKNGPL